MKSKLEELGRLARAENGEGMTPEEEAKLMADVEKVLDFVEKTVGDDVFDMQIVLDEAGVVIRDQIRDLVEGDQS